MKNTKVLVSDDDGILDVALNEDYGIQYTHLYAPRKLRETVFGRVLSGDINYGYSDLSKGIKYGVADLRIDDTNQEIEANFHSPIIGWAYDGNPIMAHMDMTLILAELLEHLRVDTV